MKFFAFLNAALCRPVRWLALVLALLMVALPAEIRGSEETVPTKSTAKQGQTASKKKAVSSAKKRKTVDAAAETPKAENPSKAKSSSSAKNKKVRASQKAESDAAPASEGKSAKTGRNAKGKAASESKADKSAPAKRSSRAAKVDQDDDRSAPAKSSAKNARSTRRHKPASRHAQASRATRAAQTSAIRKAFVASAELRPMAQQLATMRTPEAYAGVSAYARNHQGEAASAAYLALGHAYLLDKRYAEAQTAFRQSRQMGEDLADYAEFLCAQAAHEAGNNAVAETLLRGFTDRYPDSAFAVQAPELEANVLLALNDAPGAARVLEQAHGLAAEDRPGFQLARANVALAQGQRAAAENSFRQILLARPMSPEAQQARLRLAAMGVETSLSLSERRSLAEAYYNGRRFGDAGDQYRILLRVPDATAAEHNLFAVAAAACEWKLKRLSRAQAEALADTDDEAGARRSYLLMELARDRNSEADQQQIVSQMQARFPRSSWLAEALYSSGNMYLLKHNYAMAASYYGDYAVRFPSAKLASAAHWKAGWLYYRLGRFTDAARFFDEQIRRYPSSREVVAAFYWRARLYETQEGNPSMAAANYRAILRSYPHYYYALQSRQRLAALGSYAAENDDARSERFASLPAPKPVESFPEASPHLAKARLLANAGLNDYIAKEIAADPDYDSWSALGEAQIYASYGETFRALRAAKRALPSLASAPVASVPLAYWRILFPEPWWSTIKAESAKHNLDPYLVASLIRQESEFNASAVSPANAWGLMQLLPSTARQLARSEGLGRFQPYQLLDPETNIRLGTRFLRQLLDKFGGAPEYALAAYNAGDGRVSDWQSSGPYRGMDEFVESIPFTETREYVQAILRNREMYRAIDSYAQAHGTQESSLPR